MGKKALVYGRKVGDAYALQRLAEFEALQEKRLQRAEAECQKAVESSVKRGAERFEKEKELVEKETANAIESAGKDAGLEAEEVVAGYGKEGKRLQRLFEKNRERALQAAERALLGA